MWFASHPSMVLSDTRAELDNMRAPEDVGKASLAEAQRIAKLAKTQGGPYLDYLWALVEYALDDEVRASTYTQAIQPISNEEGWRP